MAAQLLKDCHLSGMEIGWGGWKGKRCVKLFFRSFGLGLISGNYIEKGKETKSAAYRYIQQFPGGPLCQARFRREGL